MCFRARAALMPQCCRTQKFLQVTSVQSHRPLISVTIQGAIMSHFSFHVVYFEQFPILWVVCLHTPLKTCWKFYVFFFYSKGACQSWMLNVEAEMGRENCLFCRGRSWEQGEATSMEMASLSVSKKFLVTEVIAGCLDSVQKLISIVSGGKKCCRIS